MAGARAAAWGIGLLALWIALAVPGARRLAWRLLPLFSGLAILVLLLPFAPQAAGSALLRGAATSLAVAGATAAAGGVAIVAALASAGAPRTLVAFLLVLARHAAGVREEAARAFRALTLRGGWDRWSRRPRAMAALLASVLDAALARADRTAEALALRGFEGRLPPLPRLDVAAQGPHLAAAAALLGVALLEALAWSR
jgi:energy-coupling factor transporter transmembrane protein EcfT